MGRSVTYMLTCLTIFVTLTTVSAARELAQEGEACKVDSLLDNLKPDDENTWTPACPAPKTAAPGRAPVGSGQAAMVPIACVLNPANNGVNFLPSYPPHYCPKLCPAGTVACCVWVAAPTPGGHECRCYKWGCPIKWNPKNHDSPL